MIHGHLKIGTRKSELALIQTEIFIQCFQNVYPHIAQDYFEVVPQDTSGDKHATERLADIGGKALFTKELDLALLEGHIDVAVYSLKDVETILPTGIKIACVLEREDPRDVFISSSGISLKDLPKGACIGTASLRRQSQILHHRPDLTIRLIRGNVPTRLQKLQREENLDATLLAFAGLKRLGIERVVTEVLDPVLFVPAAGQGALAICIREDRQDLQTLLNPLNHEETAICVTTERLLLKELEASCYTPIGVYAKQTPAGISLKCFLGTEDGSKAVYHEITGQDPAVLARSMADQLRSLFWPHKIQ
jgi:hydroxymethylbilane synthase